MNQSNNNKMKISLPAQLEDFLLSFELTEVMVSLAEKYGFLKRKEKGEKPPLEKVEEAKWTKFFDLIHAVLEGNLAPETFKEILGEELGLDPETTSKLNRDVEEKIFSKVQTSLQQLYEIKEKIMPRYPEKEVWKLYESLPKQLKEAVFAKETIEAIEKVCQRNGIENKEEILKVARVVSEVLLGLLPPDEVSVEIEKVLALKPEEVKRVAKSISFGIHRFIFRPLKESLEALYAKEVRPPGILPRPEIVERPKEPRKDIYREPIE
jgi:hypothetical protein